MKIQLALDRFTIEEAISIANEVKDSIDWIEVGTSLIKEFGIESVKQIKAAFPDKTIVADIKTIDNAIYEAELCFKAGADVMTVMGAASTATMDACFKVAKDYGKDVMIDLLNLKDDDKRELLRYEHAIFCEHVSKDDQEMGGQKNDLGTSVFQDKRLAVAGGITESSFDHLQSLQPEVAIVGSAITKASDPRKSAAKLRELAQQQEGIQ